MTDDEEYERRQGENDLLADMEAQVNPALAVPAPEKFEVDLPALERLILREIPPGRRDEWNDGLLTYRHGDWDDEHGWGRVVVKDRSGREVMVGRCHWSSIVLGGEPS